MKRKLKNILSKKIFYVTLALILVGIVEIVYASNLINSKNVSYSNSSSKLTSTNVQGAIDELYKNCKDVKETCPDSKICTEKSNINYFKSLIVSSGDGLYQDSVESNKYFYRGTNPKNYIMFSSELYRIINVNSDGTIRIIKNKSINVMPFDSLKNNRYSSNNSYCNNSTYGCNVWGSNKTMRDSTGKLITKMPRQVGETTAYDLPNKEAELNVYLNNTWFQSLKDKLYIKNNSSYNVGMVKFTNSDYQSLAMDLQQEESYTWQGSVGLIEISDYPRTNSNQKECSSVNENNGLQNYLQCYTHSWLFDPSGWYWTITPYSNNSSEFIYTVRSDKYIGGDYGTITYGVYPVMTLKSGLNLIGTGDINSPYQIVDN